MNVTIDTFDVAVLLGCEMREVWALLSGGLLHAAIIGGVFRFSQTEVERLCVTRREVRRT